MPFPSDAFRSSGLQLQYDIGAGPVTVAEVNKVSKSGAKQDFADVTNFDSIGAVKEKLPTLLEPGQVKFDGNYLGNADATGSQAELQAMFNGQVKAAWSIVLPPGAGETVSRGSWTFEAYVGQVDLDFPIEKQSTFSCTLEITGNATFNP